MFPDFKNAFKDSMSNIIFPVILRQNEKQQQ